MFRGTFHSDFTSVFISLFSYSFLFVSLCCFFNNERKTALYSRPFSVLFFLLRNNSDEVFAIGYDFFEQYRHVPFTWHIFVLYIYRKQLIVNAVLIYVRQIRILDFFLLKNVIFISSKFYLIFLLSQLIVISQNITTYCDIIKILLYNMSKFINQYSKIIN